MDFDPWPYVVIEKSSPLRSHFPAIGYVWDYPSPNYDSNVLLFDFLSIVGIESDVHLRFGFYPWPFGEPPPHVAPPPPKKTRKLSALRLGRLSARSRSSAAAEKPSAVTGAASTSSPG